MKVARQIEGVSGRVGLKSIEGVAYIGSLALLAGQLRTCPPGVSSGPVRNGLFIRRWRWASRRYPSFR